MAANFIEMLKLVAIDAIFVVILALVLTPLAQYKRAAFEDPEGAAVAFTLDLVAKDLDLLLALAERLGVTVDQARANRAAAADAVVGGLGGADMSAMAVHLRRRRDEG